MNATTNDLLDNIIEFWEGLGHKDIRETLGKLRKLYTHDEEAIEWLYEEQGILNGKAPIDLIIEGKNDEMLRLAWNDLLKQLEMLETIIYS